MPAGRISKRKQACPIQAPPSLGYADLEMERAARRPRYIDITLALRCPDAGMWTSSLPTPSRKGLIQPGVDYSQKISLLNDRSERRSQPYTLPTATTNAVTTRLSTALSNKTNKLAQIGHDPSGKVPDTPSSLLPRNTIPTYAKKAVAGSNTTYPYPGVTAIARRNSSAVGSRRGSSALQRSNSGDSLSVFAGGASRRGTRASSAVASRATSPVPPAARAASGSIGTFIINSIATPADSPDMPEDGEEEEEDEDDEKDYRPPKHQRKRQSPASRARTAEPEQQPAQPTTRSSGRLTRSARASPAPASGSEYDSDASTASAASGLAPTVPIRGRPRLAAAPVAAPPGQNHTALANPGHRTVPVPLALAKTGPAAYLKDAHNAPKMHSPLSQTFSNAVEDTALPSLSGIGEYSSQAIVA
jgi:hypothetical protein